ncbi:MAG: DUF2975 domain-containing protein [Vitreimonas sp.]
MSDATAPHDGEIRRQSKIFSDVLMVAAVLMAVMLAFNVGWPLARALRGALEGEPWRVAVKEVGLNLIGALPAVLLLLGVFAAQRVFARMSEGAIFTRANAVDIGRIGENMLWAAIAAVVISPTLAGFVRGDRDLSIDLGDWVLLLGVLGVAVGLMGRVLGLATQIKAENDQIV